MPTVCGLEALLKRAGVSEIIADMKSGSLDTHYFQYVISTDPNTMRWIYVESTATQVMDGLTRLPLEAQHKLFLTIVSLLPEVGDMLVIRDDRPGRKRNEVKIVRTRSHGSSVNLLLTR